MTCDNFSLKFTFQSFRSLNENDSYCFFLGRQFKQQALNISLNWNPIDTRS